jgi:hypothetical protein
MLCYPLIRRIGLIIGEEKAARGRYFLTGQVVLLIKVLTVIEK